jgi:phenylpropionate dioxygenase-like ring-hydroxylating dioxygenase large terminal subunit
VIGKRLPRFSPSTPYECTPGYRFPFTPFPFGWYRVATSEEVGRKGSDRIKRIKACGQDLVVFRGDDGKPRVIHAHCPHLGADLSKGGRVVGNTIACPFHDWRFDGEGRCVHIPYCDKIPPKAKIGGYAVREQDGLIFFWYHPEGEAPAFEIPEGPFRKDASWNPPLHFTWTIRMHIQEVAENAVDVTHFPKVHFYETTPKIETLAYDGPSFAIDLRGRRFGGRFVGDAAMWIRYSGLGVVHSKVTTLLGHRFPIEAAVILTTTPIDEEHVQLSILARHRKTWNPAFDALIRPLMRREIRADFENDIPIWESKRYHAQPVLCRDDGPIAPLRRWARQFYLEPQAEAAE